VLVSVADGGLRGDKGRLAPVAPLIIARKTQAYGEVGGRFSHLGGRYKVIKWAFAEGKKNILKNFL